MPATAQSRSPRLRSASAVLPLQQRPAISGQAGKKGQRTRPARHVFPVCPEIAGRCCSDRTAEAERRRGDLLWTVADIAAQGAQLLGPLRRRCSNDAALPQWIFLPALTTRCHETARAHYDPKRPDRRGQRPTSSCCCCGSRLPLPPIWSALWFGLKASAAPATGPALPTTKYPPPTNPTHISPTH